MKKERHIPVQHVPLLKRIEALGEAATVLKKMELAFLETWTTTGLSRDEKNRAQALFNQAQSLRFELIGRAVCARKEEV